MKILNQLVPGGTERYTMSDINEIVIRWQEANDAYKAIHAELLETGLFVEQTRAQLYEFSAARPPSRRQAARTAYEESIAPANLEFETVQTAAQAAYDEAIERAEDRWNEIVLPFEEAYQAAIAAIKATESDEVVEPRTPEMVKLDVALKAASARWSVLKAEQEVAGRKLKATRDAKLQALGRR